MDNITDCLFENKKSSNRKTITITMNEGDLKEINDCLQLDILKNNAGHFCGRDTFIELAVHKGIEQMKKEIHEIQKKREHEPKNQVIIFACSEETGDYERKFKNNCWYEVTLSDKVVELINNKVIKYLALYRGVPYRYIDSYAEILKVSKLSNEKYKFELGKIKELDKPLPVKVVEPLSFTKGIMIRLEQLLNSDVLDNIDRFK